MNDKYILKGKEVVQCDLTTWAKWYETADRDVAKDTVNDSDISTVFLRLNHSFGSGPPLLFETLIFGGLLDGERDRYETWEQAEEGHQAMVKRVKSKTNNGINSDA